MALNATQQASRLFKKSLGAGETLVSKEFFSEPKLGRDNILPSQLWAEASGITNTAPILSDGGISGVTQYFSGVTLSVVLGSANLAYYHDNLKNAIPFNYGDGSYNYALYKSDTTQIPFGAPGGDWLIDTSAGLLTWYGTLPTGVSDVLPPHIAFYRYVGATGFTDTSIALSTEISLRTSADQSLSSMISQSITGITSLSSAISGETSSRISGDNSLSTGISTRVNVDLSLSAAISTEISTRDSVDIVLSSNIVSRGDTFIDGTPVVNQVGVWTGGNTIEGTTGLTWDESTLEVHGTLNIFNNKITNLYGPTDNLDAANKAYVDAIAQGVAVHAPVHVVATSVTVLSGETTIDGHYISEGEFVLVAGQGLVTSGDSKYNGIYVVHSGLTGWTRRPDADGNPNNEVELGDFVFVQSGVTNGSTGWAIGQTDAPTGQTYIIPDVNTQLWFKMAAPTAYFADNEGIGLTGTTFSLVLDGTTLSKSPIGLKVSNSLSTVISSNTTNISSLSTSLSIVSGNTGIIGPAEDGSYTDGIFTDFTSGTTIGTAIDRFNEMFLLLAPAPPSGDWTGAFAATQPVLSTSVLSSSTRMVGTGSPTSNVVTSTPTPAFTISSSVGMGVTARTRNGAFIFTLRDYNTSIIETTTINSVSTTKSTGTLRYTVGDPYTGISGQQGFWSGVTGFSGVSFTSSSITAGTTARNLYFEHPTGQFRTGTTFYVDDVTANTPSVTSLVMGTLPTMTRFVSGVPSLPTSSQFSITSFSITNVSTYFYAPSPVWSSVATTTGFATFTGDISNIPAYNGTGTVGVQTLTIDNNYVTNFQFTIQAKNRNNTLAGSTSGWTSNNTLRYDGSNESTRLTSGVNNYPSTGWGGVWGANSGVSLLTNTNELQMLNGSYVYPTTNYITWGGPNYSSISNTRWVTFNLGSFSTKANFRITFNGATNITAAPQANLLIEVLASGSTATKWVDADATYSGVGNPGDPSGLDGVASVTAYATTYREITFGAVALTGNLIVRVGYTVGSNVTFTSLTKTDIS